MFFYVFFFGGLNHIQVPASPPFRIPQTAKVSAADWSYISAIRRLIRDGTVNEQTKHKLRKTQS